MPYSFFIARRFLQTQKSQSQRFISFITFFSIAGVALGVMALIITLTILAGFEKELKEKIFSFTAHVQVTAFQSRPITEYSALTTKIAAADSSVLSVSPFIAKEGMVSFGEYADGVFVKGISPEGIHEVQKYIVGGKIDFKKIDGGLYSCVIGKKLLDNIRASLNDTIIGFGLPREFSSAIQPRIVGFVVTGIYESGMAEYDDVFLYASIEAAQEIFELQNSVSGFDIMLSQPQKADDVAKELSSALGFPYFARSIFQQYKNLFTWIQLQKEPIPIVLGLITLVAAINIIGTLLMLVLEKKKQIGILRSLGATQKEIKQIFIVQGFLVSLVGTLFGNIAGFSVCWIQLKFQIFTLPSSIYFMKSVPILFQAENFLIVSTVSILLCVAASFIPARLASQLDPIKAIRQ